MNLTVNEMVDLVLLGLDPNDLLTEDFQSMVEKAARLGKGIRFKGLAKKIMDRPGFKPRIAGQSPEQAAAAIAAKIGRKKYGKEKFQKLALAGKKRK